ncbi:hypothetical protein [Euryhalocaulis caribicus]|uniref:hypothetical protein n=1 Tax=Euryhalocaulis caribicus TaxID=1161401 RepID=UPI00039C062C|nr:hypothetical protein [Euryhalocaulis caribicus]
MQRFISSSREGVLKSGARRLAAAVIMGGLMIVALGAAALLTVAAFAVAAVLMTLGALIYLFAWLKRGRKDGGDDESGVLDARKGPSGWTVDTAGRFGH